jgi:TatD DNase family protein
VTNYPLSDDYIDIHTHGGSIDNGVFFLENLMAHELRTPETLSSQAYTFGIHPWFLTENNIDQQIERVNTYINHTNVIAVGEAGYDRLRGASPDLQRRAFEKQIEISEDIKKPVVIHCVRAWDELIDSKKRLKPLMPWLIHGFRGSVGLAKQLLSKGIYFSFCLGFVLRPESANLLRSMPKDRIFLETDGADIEIRTIYKKVAMDLNLSVDELKSIIQGNFMRFFCSQTP